MANSILLKLTGWLTGLVTNWLIPVISFFAGRKSKENDSAKEQLKEIRDVKTIHERMRRDAAYRHRVRAYFKKPKS